MDFTIDAINKLIEEKFEDMKMSDQLPGWRWGYTYHEMYDRAEDLCHELYKFIHANIPSFPEDAISYSSIRNNGNSYDVYIRFNEDALWRDSLYQGDARPSWRNYSERSGKYGTSNIVKQFDVGWHTGGTVTGMWHGKMTTSRRSRRATHMLQGAIDAFNNKYACIKRGCMQGLWVIIVDKRFRGETWQIM